MLHKIILGLVLTFLLLQMPISKAGAHHYSKADDAVVTIQAKTLDPRAEALKSYLAAHNSPLQDHAQDFIDAADTYGVDWKLVPAIAGVESTFGKAIPGGFNGWGWGVYGTQAIYFKNWRDGIFTVTKGLKDGYISKGLIDPYSINRIYASSPMWGSRVSFFISEIDNHSKNFHQNNNLQAVKLASVLPETAGLSAKLANSNNNYKLNFLD